jgi:hypothetical protein
LFGTHNVMLGEFYDRTLVYLHLLYSHNDWVKSSQLYLHLFKPYRGLMDSHRVFTEPYRSWPLRSLAELWDEANCECISRLVLCGYSVERVDDTTDVGRYVPKRYRPGPMSGNYDHDTIDHGADQQQQQHPAKKDATVLLVKPASWDNEFEYGSNATVRDVRNYIRSQLIVNNPGVQTDMARYRTWVHDGIYPKDEKSDFVLVGLTQRLGRRRWRNLDDVMREVQARLKHSEAALGKRIVLVEMNVEEDSSSYQQLVRHGALDGLIGIHGAQLTEAVWMKDGAWVIELLPYIPSYSMWGQWTRMVHKPTPLGEIFRHTELNHAGHRLAIDSSPYCDGNESIRECWTDRYNMWDTRDFVVNVDLLERIVETFFAVPTPKGKKGDPALHCQDWNDRAAPDFVMYNVNCAESSDQAVSPHAYYWPLEGAEPLNEKEERKRQH